LDGKIRVSQIFRLLKQCNGIGPELENYFRLEKTGKLKVAVLAPRQFRQILRDPNSAQAGAFTLWERGADALIGIRADLGMYLQAAYLAHELSHARDWTRWGRSFESGGVESLDSEARAYAVQDRVVGELKRLFSTDAERELSGIETNITQQDIMFAYAQK